MFSTLMQLFLGASPLTLSPAQTGINGAALYDADGVNPPASSNAITMAQCLDGICDQLFLSLEVTFGTTASFYGYCSESSDGTNYARIQLCTDATESVCSPLVNTWTKASWDGKKISYHIRNSGTYVKCQFWTPDNSNGTIVVRGNRSKQ